MKDIKQIWKDLANNKAATATHVVQYAVLKAIRSRSNVDKKHIAASILLKAFTPVTNKVKLANGRRPWDTLDLIGLYGKVNPFAYDRNGNVVVKKDRHVLNRDPLDIFETDEEMKLFSEVVDAMRSAYMSRRYVYVIVQQEGLSREQQLVQASHATMVLGHKLKDLTRVNDLYFTVVGTDNLLRERNAVRSLGHAFEEFVEPDLGNKLTAIAVHPVSWHERGDLLKYNLLTFNP